MNLKRTAAVSSPWIVHFNCGGCGGCDSEIWTALTPVYDAERLGIVNAGNPKHADLMLLTGTGNGRNYRVIRQLYRQMSEPKIVIAVGNCACNGNYLEAGGESLCRLDKIIPVDVFVPGCAVRPEAVIEGILLGLKKLGTITEKKLSRAAMARKLEAEQDKEKELLEELKVQEEAYFKLKAQIDAQKRKEDELQQILQLEEHNHNHD